MTGMIQKPIVRYLVVGIGSLAVDYFLLLVLYHGFGVHITLASSVGFLVGLVVNFLLNKTWSFKAGKGGKQSAKQAFMYALLVAFNLMFTSSFVSYFATISIGPEVSKIVTTAAITLWNYLLYKTVIFKEVKEPTV